MGPPTRCANTNPGVGRKKATVQPERLAKTSISKSLALASVFGALYAILVVALAPISFLPFQVRFADALLPLAVLFGWPVALGVAIGAAVGNFVGSAIGSGVLSPSVWIDVVGGSIANLLAGLTAWKLGTRKWLPARKMWFLATVPQTLIVSLIVGSYLGFIIPNPVAIELSVFGVAIGSIVAINFLGYLLLRGIGRPSTLQSLDARGLVVHGVSGKREDPTPA